MHSDLHDLTIRSPRRHARRLSRQGLEELGLTYPQWIAIVALWEEDGQTVSELGNKMFLESNTLTPMQKKLESMGYLRRRLREKGMHMNLVKSTGLAADEFVRLQKSVVALRDI